MRDPFATHADEVRRDGDPSVVECGVVQACRRRRAAVLDQSALPHRPEIAGKTHGRLVSRYRFRGRFRVRHKMRIRLHPALASDPAATTDGRFAAFDEGTPRASDRMKIATQRLRSMKERSA